MKDKTLLTLKLNSLSSYLQHSPLLAAPQLVLSEDPDLVDLGRSEGGEAGLLHRPVQRLLLGRDLPAVCGESSGQ